MCQKLFCKEEHPPIVHVFVELFGIESFGTTVPDDCTQKNELYAHVTTAIKHITLYIRSQTSQLFGVCWVIIPDVMGVLLLSVLTARSDKHTSLFQQSDTVECIRFHS